MSGQTPPVRPKNLLGNETGRVDSRSKRASPAADLPADLLGISFIGRVDSPLTRLDNESNLQCAVLLSQIPRPIAKEMAMLTLLRVYLYVGMFLCFTFALTIGELTLAPNDALFSHLSALIGWLPAPPS